MEETVGEDTEVATRPKDNHREELYNQFGVSWVDSLAIRYILPILDSRIQTHSTFDVSARSKILAEIALLQAYKREPKFRLLVWGIVLISAYDYLHYLNPAFYGLLIGALVTLNGFIGSLRSPTMMAAELEDATDEDGMPADYRATGHTSANTNVTLVLFVFAVGVQLVVTSSIVQGEIVAQNVADGSLPIAVSAIALLNVPMVVNRLRGRNTEN